MSLTAPSLWRGRAADWIERRNERERLLLAVAVALVALLALVTLVWRPTLDARSAAKAEITADDAVIARLQAAGPQLVTHVDTAHGPPAGVITSSAAEAGLTIQRLEPAGGRIAVTLEDADFDKVMPWLAAVERQGLRIGELKLDRRPPPGVVNVQLSVVSP